MRAKAGARARIRRFGDARGTGRSNLHVFAGVEDASLFDFARPVYEIDLEYAAPDLLFPGRGKGRRYEVIPMDHRHPGCGYLVERFGDDASLILAQGDDGQAGHNLLSRG